MPVYSYHCPACGKNFEKLVKERDRKHVICEDCGERVLQRPVMVSHVWKGGKPE